MTQVEKLIKIIMPDLLKYLKIKESGELAQKRLDIRARLARTGSGYSKGTEPKDKS